MKPSTAASTGAAVALIALVPGWWASPSAGAADTSGEIAMKQARKEAAHRRRRIIMNNDGNDCRNRPPGAPKNAEAFLAKRTTPLVGSQVDAIFYCTGVFNYYTHASEETECRDGGDRGVEDWAYELKEIEGRDSLEIMTDFGHEHGMDVFWSMRMNDTHDSSDEVLMAQWKRHHPEYLMGEKGQRFPHGAGRWSSVNYALPEVREKVFRILWDVGRRYDVDGLELDFYRHPVYFKPQMLGEPVTQEQCDMMTGLVRRVRRMTESVAMERGRPMLIAVRVPDSVAFCKAIGLDIARWLEEDLIDIVTGGGYFHMEPWENLVALGKQYDVPVYACLSASRIVSAGQPESEGAIEPWRGEAARAWEAGVSGIYTFNRFDPNDPIFRELGSPETLRGLPATYEWNTGSRGSMRRWLRDGDSFVKGED